MGLSNCKQFPQADDFCYVCARENKMDWNEFNRQLQNRVNDPGVRYCMGVIYERLLDVSKQVDMCATICNELANTMNNFVALNEVFDSRLKELNKHVRGNVDGVSVESVPLTNDDIN